MMDLSSFGCTARYSKVDAETMLYVRVGVAEREVEMRSLREWFASTLDVFEEALSYMETSRCQLQVLGSKKKFLELVWE